MGKMAIQKASDKEGRIEEERHLTTLQPIAAITYLTASSVLAHLPGEGVADALRRLLGVNPI